LGIPQLVYTTLIIDINQFLVQGVWLKELFTWQWEYNLDTYGFCRPCCCLQFFFDPQASLHPAGI